MRKIKVSKWFGEKLHDAAFNYHRFLKYDYTQHPTIDTKIADHTIVYVAAVLAESEKAYQMALEASNTNDDYREWITWIPKSQIEEVLG